MRGCHAWVTRVASRRASPWLQMCFLLKQIHPSVSFPYFFSNLSVKLNFCLRFDSKEKPEVLVSIGYNIGDPLELATAVRYSVWLSQYLIKIFAIIAMRRDDIATKYCQISVQMTNTGGCFFPSYLRCILKCVELLLEQNSLNSASILYLWNIYFSLSVVLL